MSATNWLLQFAKEIMDSGKHQLHSNYGNLFNYQADKTNNEFIMKFDIESHANSATNSFRDLAPQYRTGNSQSYVISTKSLVDSYWTKQGRPIYECPLYSEQEYELGPKMNRDPRLSASVFGHDDDFYSEDVPI